MEEIYTQWRKELIEAGLLRPDEEIDDQRLIEMYQNYQVTKIKSLMQGSFADLIPSEPPSSKHRKSSAEKGEISASKSDSPTPSVDGTNIDLRKGMKKALDALLTVAKGANYCMFVVSRAWINFRYRTSKDNLHLQVAGNQYISPLKLNESDIRYLSNIDIFPEEGSIDIFCREFDETPRNLDMIVDTIVEIFNEVYHIREGESAYIELDLAKGEDESVRNDIAQHFSSRDGKQFKFKWDKSI